MYLVFDTETTGMPRNWQAPLSDSQNWPHMVQIAWQSYDFGGKLLEERMAVIYPEGYTIPQQVARLHGVTQARALAEGENLVSILTEFSDILSRTSLLIAHNIDFDLNIVGAEYYRTGMENPFPKKNKACTMRKSINYCKFPGKNGKYRFPSLTKLHQKIFGEAFPNAHDALADVAACARCFFELKRMGYIK